jgi:Fic family protein
MNSEVGHSNLALPVLKAILAHLYLLWIHPFGDGNGRVARLVEYQILLSAGVPNPATHLLSNHYNETRSEYYRRLDRASREHTGVMDFLVYALQGFVDGLTEQLKTIKDQIRKDMWTNYVHVKFRDRPSRADTRRRHLVLDLSEYDEPVRRRDIRLLTPRLAEAYSGKTDKTITRDLNALSQMGLIAKKGRVISAKKEIMQAFSG